MQTVGELIAELQKHPLDMRVVVRGYENGWDDYDIAEEIEILTNHHDGGGCYGAHMPNTSYHQKPPCKYDLDRGYTVRPPEKVLWLKTDPEGKEYQ